MDLELGNLLHALSGEGAYGESALAGFFPYFTFISRFIIPILALIVLSRCLTSLLREKYEPEIWAYLSLPNATRVALYHWENIIGRAKNTDVVLNYPTLSRNHVALIRDDKANWTAIDLDSKSGTTLNGKPFRDQVRVKKGDVLGLGGVEVALLDLKSEELGAQSLLRTKPGRWVRPSGTFFFLTLLQAVLAMQLSISHIDNFTTQIPLGFLALAGMMWGYFFFIRAMGRTGFEVETLAFFLCTIGMSAIASRRPDELLYTVTTIFGGLLFFIIVCWILRDLRWAKKLRWPIAICGVLLLAIVVLFGVEIHGATRWITIAGFTVQPSELVKVAFVFAGASSLERMFAKRNLFMFIGYSIACVGILALMNDFGSAAVFFATFLVIAFLRSGDLATIALSLTSLGIAGFLALTIRPHVAYRFATWGNVWDDPFGRGMQQVRMLSSTASGGFFGLGAGEGTFWPVFASDTDLVFGMVAEELGLLVGIFCIAVILIFGFFVVKTSGTARSSFYVIAAGAAVTMFLTQTILNVFGPLDILPFTGITFPFLSRGGSSMIGSWGLLAFIKAADTRQNASFAIKLNRRDMRKVRKAEQEGEAWDEEAEMPEPYEDEYDEYEVFDYDDLAEEYEELRGEPLDGGIDSYYFDEHSETDPGIDPYYFDDVRTESDIDPRYFDDWEGRQ